jgi:hypothetical protein
MKLLIQCCVDHVCKNVARAVWYIVEIRVLTDQLQGSARYVGRPLVVGGILSQRVAFNTQRIAV